MRVSLIPEVRLLAEVEDVQELLPAGGRTDGKALGGPGRRAFASSPPRTGQSVEVRAGVPRPYHRRTRVAARCRLSMTGAAADLRSELVEKSATALVKNHRLALNRAACGRPPSGSGSEDTTVRSRRYPCCRVRLPTALSPPWRPNLMYGRCSDAPSSTSCGDCAAGLLMSPS